MIRTRTLYAPFKVNAKAAIGWEKAPLNKVELEGIMIMMVDGADGFLSMFSTPGCSIQTEEKSHSCLLSGSSPVFEDLFQ